MMFDIHQQSRILKYSLGGAIGALFAGMAISPVPVERSELAARLQNHMYFIETGYLIPDQR